MQRAMHRADAEDMGDLVPDGKPRAKPRGAQRRHTVDAKNDRAVARGRQLWTSPGEASEARARTRRPNVAGDGGEHIKARRKKNVEQRMKPFAGKTQPRSDYYREVQTIWFCRPGAARPKACWAAWQDRAGYKKKRFGP